MPSLALASPRRYLHGLAGGVPGYFEALSSIGSPCSVGMCPGEDQKGVEIIMGRKGVVLRHVPELPRDSGPGAPREYGVYLYFRYGTCHGRRTELGENHPESWGSCLCWSSRAVMQVAIHAFTILGIACDASPRAETNPFQHLHCQVGLLLTESLIRVGETITIHEKQLHPLIPASVMANRPELMASMHSWKTDGDGGVECPVAIP